MYPKSQRDSTGKRSVRSVGILPYVTKRRYPNVGIHRLGLICAKIRGEVEEFWTYTDIHIYIYKSLDEEKGGWDNPETVTRIPERTATLHCRILFQQCENSDERMKGGATTNSIVSAGKNNFDCAIVTVDEVNNAPGKRRSRKQKYYCPLRNNFVSRRHRGGGDQEVEDGTDKSSKLSSRELSFAWYLLDKVSTRRFIEGEHAYATSPPLLLHPLLAAI